MFCDLNCQGHHLALIQGQQQLTYNQLEQKVAAFVLQLSDIPSLYFLKASNDIETVIAYLACLRSKHVLMLLDAELSDDKLAPLLEAYQPNAIISAGEIKSFSAYTHKFSPELALLLSTSGSTGSPKQVALSLKNLNANAHSICQYLPIKSTDKTITTLPMHYSYGLSVINSHLLAGACIVLNEHSVLSREFWQDFKHHQISSFAGVPYSYEMLLRLRFTNMTLPSLRYFTQAGGKLAKDKVIQLVEYAQQTDKQFFVMYGQTEATARMAFMEQNKALDKPESIGQAIPGGEFRLVDEQGRTISEAGQSGELCYSGGNVMLGYCQHYTDLAVLDSDTWLHTGDVATFDEEGDYTITGRLKRFIKVFGQRLNLDDIEHYLAQKGLETYCMGEDNKLQIAVKNNNDIKALKQLICQHLQIHHTVVQLISVSELPLTSNGKKAYQNLQAEFDV